MVKIGCCLFGPFIILGEQMITLSSHGAEKMVGREKPKALCTENAPEEASIHLSFFGS